MSWLSLCFHQKWAFPRCRTRQSVQQTAEGQASKVFFRDQETAWSQRTPMAKQIHVTGPVDESCRHADCLGVSLNHFLLMLNVGKDKVRSYMAKMLSMTQGVPVKFLNHYKCMIKSFQNN
jgi:hypothetical protein